MIDKHSPSHLAIHLLGLSFILCWFHVMSTIREKMNDLKISWEVRYPIAMAFKIIGRSRSANEASIRFTDYYISFIQGLELDSAVIDEIIMYIRWEWMHDEWLLGWIDAGCISNNGGKVSTINNKRRGDS